MSKVAKRIYFPKTRLAELAARPGGITRGDALEEATKSISSMMDIGLETTNRSIVAIEKIAYSAKDGKLDPKHMLDVLREGDQIVTMAATFGFAGLEEAAKSLCDVADGLLQHGMHDAAPIIVHIQSMRLLMPGEHSLGEVEAQKILDELAKVRAHYQFARLSASAPGNVGPDDPNE